MHHQIAFFALRALCTVALLSLCACDGRKVSDGQLAINELMANNEGAAVDELGEIEDWIELVNVGEGPVDLADYTLSDDGNEPVALPDIRLLPHEHLVLWADDTAAQGPLHLPFKLSSSGGTLDLVNRHDERASHSVTFPSLGINESFARFADGEFAPCRYATPRRDNGVECTPPTRSDLPDDVTYGPYEWPEQWPPLQGPLIFSELGLQPAAFVEVLNVSQSEIDLADYAVTLAAHAPGHPWPRSDQGVTLSWGAQERLAPGERVRIDVGADDTGEIAARAEFEGVATLFERNRDEAIERVDFMHWPEGAVLARSEDRGALRFCNVDTAGAPNTECDPVSSRGTHSRLRHLYTPGDFAALAAGGTSVGIESVKFVIDLAAGGVVHFLGSQDYALHYTFVREEIEGNPPLDRCDPAQAQEFLNGWIEFSQQEYFRTQGRRYLLGTLNHHVGPGLRTVDFAEGDAITAAQAKLAFFSVTANMERASHWQLHPSNAEQAQMMRALDGQAPIVGQNAPFQGLTLQPLTPGVAYGQLRFVPGSELAHATLGPDVIVVTDDVPNDLAFVGGLITEAFQTPLAHVNVLSRNRNTPNMALADARNDERIAQHLGELVRFEVSQSGFTIERAELAEAQEFWESRRPQGAPLVPRQDPSLRGVQLLEQHDFTSLPALGAKAAQLAELIGMFRTRLGANAVLPTPPGAFAVPIVHYLEHFAQSGAQEIYEESLDALQDPAQRPAILAAIRGAIVAHPIDPELLTQLHDHIESTFGGVRVRFRSSSNSEDLSEFNGAGLYTSISAEIDDAERPIEGALDTVWSSLWNDRAYDEREYGNVDHAASAMGVLVHPAYLSELANGVAISRDIFDPIRSDQYYVNVQFGEASVANPAPGVASEEFVVRWTWPGHPVTYSSRSSLIDGTVMTQGEIDQLIVYLQMIHNHFQALLDPEKLERWFAMDIEFKLYGPERRLIVKQARPYSFGQTAIPDDCREF